MGSLIAQVRRCDSVPYPGSPEYESIQENCYKFYSEDNQFLGYVIPIVARKLDHQEHNGIVTDHDAKKILLNSKTLKAKDFTEGIGNITAQWRAEGAFSVLKGWRDELYGVNTPAGQPYFAIERSAACLFGLTTYGVHIIGYVPAEDKNDWKIWVPQRSFTKATNPGKLDNTVAGGIAFGMSTLTTVVKECGEEAGLSEEYVRSHLTAAGKVQYNFRHAAVYDNVDGVFQPEVEYIYDLIMEENVTPVVTDGEVHEFRLMSIQEVMESLLEDDDWKYNCALIQIDFFIRHGFIGRDHKDYEEIQRRSHRQFEELSGHPDQQQTTIE